MGFSIASMSKCCIDGQKVTQLNHFTLAVLVKCRCCSAFNKPSKRFACKVSRIKIQQNRREVGHFCNYKQTEVQHLNGKGLQYHACAFSSQILHFLLSFFCSCMCVLHSCICTGMQECRAAIQDMQSILKTDICLFTLYCELV